MLEHIKEDIVTALGSAIARHHSAFAGSPREFQLDPRSQVEVRKVLDQFGLSVDLLVDQPPSLAQRQIFAQDWIINPEHEDHEEMLPLYWYVVRRLRLADQRSNDWIEQERGD